METTERDKRQKEFLKRNEEYRAELEGLEGELKRLGPSIFQYVKNQKISFEEDLRSLGNDEETIQHQLAILGTRSRKLFDNAYHEVYGDLLLPFRNSTPLIVRNRPDLQKRCEKKGLIKFWGLVDELKMTHEECVEDRYKIGMYEGKKEPYPYSLIYMDSEKYQKMEEVLNIGMRQIQKHFALHVQNGWFPIRKRIGHNGAIYTIGYWGPGFPGNEKPRMIYFIQRRDLEKIYAYRVNA